MAPRFLRVIPKVFVILFEWITVCRWDIIFVENVTGAPTGFGVENKNTGLGVFISAVHIGY